MIEESTGAALGIFDEKFTTGFAPDLCVGPGHDLRFEREFVRVESVGLGNGYSGAFGKPTYAQCRVAFSDITDDGVKAEGATTVEVWYQADAVRRAR